MKQTEHIEKLLRQGRNPKELVELGFAKSVVTRVRRRLAEEKTGVQRKRRQGKGKVPPVSGGKDNVWAPATPTGAMPPAFTAEDIEADPEIVELKKQIRKAELERELGRAKMPPEAAVLVAAAQEIGEYSLEFCPHVEDGLCTWWGWDTQDEIPNGIGEPIPDGKGVYRIKPSVLYCAMCPGPLKYAFDRLEGELENNPLRNLRERFCCECEAKGMVAVHIQCTKCGKETCRGWWPEK